MKTAKHLIIVSFLLFVTQASAVSIDNLVGALGKLYRDTETGTFITRDPLGFVDGPNMYPYVNQNPWTKFDPLGLYANERFMYEPPGLMSGGSSSSAGVALTMGVLQSNSGMSFEELSQLAAEEGLETTMGGGFGAGAISGTKLRINPEGNPNVSPKYKDPPSQTKSTEVDVEQSAKETVEQAGNEAIKKTPWNSSHRQKAWKEKGQPDGKAPQREIIVQNRKTGEIETRIESKELHHKKPRREGGPNTDENLQDVWPQEHEAIDPNRHIDYDMIDEIPEDAFYDG